MKQLCFFMTVLMTVNFSWNVSAQKRDKISHYETVIYTSDKIDVLIQNEYKKQKENTRGYLGDLGKAVLGAGKGIAGGYVTSIIDIGVNAVASLITKSSNDKIKWEEIVKSENFYMETLSTVEPINNFYSRPSYDGPLDPAGMNFSGIGCLRMIDGDTVFFVSCHIDESKISRIINHTKFELVLDTLIVNPYQLDLPNSNFDTEFSFDKRKNLQLAVEMKLTSSWMNELTEMQKNQELGSFILSIAISPSDLDGKNKLRYVRPSNSESIYKIAGESFIIPRSYMGFRDEENKYRNSWGTGDYRVEINIRQTCGITDTYRKAWKTDWKQRQDADNDENYVQRSWKMISSQKWDNIAKKWVITTLKAPADIITEDVLQKMDISPSAAKAGGKK